jgi:hypothetical protein
LADAEEARSAAESKEEELMAALDEAKRSAAEREGKLQAELERVEGEARRAMDERDAARVECDAATERAIAVIFYLSLGS